MKQLPFAAIALLVPLNGCALTPEQKAWNDAHHVGDIPLGGTPGVISTSPQAADSRFNGKDYPDPNPHSASDDAQRAAYIQHRQEQEESATRPSEPDLSTMSCSGTSNVVTAANAGSMTSSTNCHN